MTQPWPNFISPNVGLVTILHHWKGSRFHHPKKAHKKRCQAYCTIFLQHCDMLIHRFHLLCNFKPTSFFTKSLTGVQRPYQTCQASQTKFQNERFSAKKGSPKKMAQKGCYWHPKCWWNLELIIMQTFKKQQNNMLNKHRKPSNFTSLVQRFCKSKVD